MVARKDWGGCGGVGVFFMLVLYHVLKCRKRFIFDLIRLYDTITS